MIGKKNKTRKTEIIIKKLWKLNKKKIFFALLFRWNTLATCFFLNQYININKIEIAKTCFTPRKAPFI